MFEKLYKIFSITNREPLPDLLRGIAILFMIQIHITENLLLYDPVNLIFEKWSYFLGGIPAAPIFVLLMGYYQASSKSPLKNELLRGLKLILLGFALNFLLNLSLIYKYFVDKEDVEILNYILGVDILIFAGLSYTIIAALKRLITKDLVFLLLVPFIHIISYASTNINIESKFLHYLLSFFIKVSDWSYFPVIPWITFPIIGLYLNKSKLFEKILAKRFSATFWIFYLIMFFVLLSYGMNKSSDLNQYYSLKIDFFMYSLFFLFGWIKLWQAIIDRFSDNLLFGYLRWLGKNVTAVYVLQWIILGNITTYLYKSVTLNSCLVIFFIVLFSVTICTYLYNLSRT